MKTSRNPISGNVEFYTDEGILIGSVLTMGDLLGSLEEKNVLDAKDAEVWRTNEEGRHFKLETETGEIKAGFGGKLTGRKLGEKFTPSAESSKSSSGGVGAAPSLSGTEKTEQPKHSEWMTKMEKRREKAMSWAPERQAEYLFRQGYLTEEDAVAAMEDGSAKDRMKDYFDLMERNGDPTPTKPVRESPDLYSEIKQGLHNGDWEQARIDYVKEWTGMSQEEAETTQREMTTWFGGSWYSADTNTLDNYIDKDGAYGGDIYRGMHFTEDEYAAFMKDVAPGATIGMRGHNSSWTSDRETAWGFSVNGDRGVIIHCVGNKTSAPVSHLSTKGEDEILAHSRAQWTVIGVKEGSNRTEITVMESAERISEEERDRRKSQSDAAPEKKDDSLSARMNAQNRFWFVKAPEKANYSGASALELVKQADANLKGNGTRQKLDEITQILVKMKNAGANNEILQAYYDESGYDELIKRAQKERKNEISKLRNNA